MKELKDLRTQPWHRGKYDLHNPDLASVALVSQSYGPGLWGYPSSWAGPPASPFSRLYAILRLYELSLSCLLPLISVQLLTGKTLAPALHGSTAV